jgi:hypothetical protein
LKSENFPGACYGLAPVAVISACRACSRKSRPGIVPHRLSGDCGQAGASCCRGGRG